MSHQRRKNTRTVLGHASQFHNDKDQERVFPDVGQGGNSAITPFVNAVPAITPSNVQTTPLGPGSTNGNTPGTGSYKFTIAGQTFDSWASAVTSGISNPALLFSDETTLWQTGTVYTAVGIYTDTVFSVGTNGVQYNGWWVELGLPEGQTRTVDGIKIMNRVGFPYLVPTITHVLACRDSSRAQYDHLATIYSPLNSQQPADFIGLTAIAGTVPYKSVRIVFERSGNSVVLLRGLAWQSVKPGNPSTAVNYCDCLASTDFVYSPNNLASYYLGLNYFEPVTIDNPLGLVGNQPNYVFKSGASSVDQFYRGGYIYGRYIIDYNGATRTATISAPAGARPDGSVVAIESQVYAYRGSYVESNSAINPGRQLQVTQNYRGDWIQYRFSDPVRCSGYRLQSLVNNYNPISRWVLLASNDGKTWEVAHDMTGASRPLSYNAIPTIFRPNTPVSATFFRLVITEVNGGVFNPYTTDGGYFHLSLFNILGTMTTPNGQQEYRAVNNRNTNGVFVRYNSQDRKTITGLMHDV